MPLFDRVLGFKVFKSLAYNLKLLAIKLVFILKSYSLMWLRIYLIRARGFIRFY
jgi:hypothetical protein